MAKIIIIGPFGDHGGRELEAGFIASEISRKHKVSVISTSNISVKSQIFQFQAGLPVTSLKQLLYRNFLSLKPATLFSYFKNGKKEPIYFYVNNHFNAKRVNRKEKVLLSKLIVANNLVLIVAHLFTLRTKEIIELCNKNKIPVIFRTTGEINFQQDFPEYLRKVNHFIHHSRKNADSLHTQVKSISYSIIDQTAFLQDQFLEIPVLNKCISNFLVVGRLSPEKNLINLIKYFKACSTENDQLVIVGEGELKAEIKSLIKDSENVQLKGHLAQRELVKVYKQCDCLIISSYTEAGPLVGMEAMASGRLILSSHAGAMPERLENSKNDFWFDPEDLSSFQNQFQRIKNLDPIEVSKIAEMNRSVYLQKYSTKKVSEAYLSVVDKFLIKEG
jgi:glycosyltransferase involved in cell wall biosynthesis